MSIFYGPIKSRRLGISLGVDIVPPKICSYNCIYCYEDAATELTIERRKYLPFKDFTALSESLKQRTCKKSSIDYVTFAGSGEPTLNTSLRDYIRFIKDNTPYRVAVITNGSLLWDPQVRRDLSSADLVVPSLDAATEDTFKRVNRPHKHISLQHVLRGLKEFCSEFEGQLWLEILLCSGINDSDTELESLAEVVESISVDKVQINTIYYAASDPSALPVSPGKMEKFRNMLSAPAEVFTGI